MQYGSNSNRFDHTQWLIHFVRDRNPDDFPDLIYDDDNEIVDCCDDYELESDAAAFSVLCNIIELGGLLPGSSYRNGITTLFGGDPVVCATEMPIYSFIQYAKSRGDKSRVSPYGVAFLKEEFYTAGARPVIYGLSGKKNFEYNHRSPTARILKESILPVSEQYRFVSFSLGGDKEIDWTHEREWRWRAEENPSHILRMKKKWMYPEDVPGLPLFNGSENGGCFSKIGFIVKSQDEVSELRDLLTKLYFSNSNKYEIPVSANVLKKSFIIVADELEKAVEESNEHKMQTIEGISSEKLLNPLIILDKTEDEREKIKLAVEKAQQYSTHASIAYLKDNPLDKGTCGFACIFSYEIGHPAVQEFLKTKMAYITSTGKVRIKVPIKYEMRQSIDYHEYIYTAVQKAFNEVFGDIFSVDSWLD